MGTRKANRQNLTGIDAMKLLMELLIAAAEKEMKITYGEVACRIAEQCDIKWNFAMRRNVGKWTMDDLMKLILKHDRDAPLLNVLLVLKGGYLKGYPSCGCEGFIKCKYPNETKGLVFPRNSASKDEIKRWKDISSKAMLEVYNFENWDGLFRDLFTKS